jgi:hypothetical protein
MNINAPNQLQTPASHIKRKLRFNMNVNRYKNSLSQSDRPQTDRSKQLETSPSPTAFHRFTIVEAFILGTMAHINDLPTELLLMIANLCNSAPMPPLLEHADVLMKPLTRGSIGKAPELSTTPPTNA